MKLQDQPAYVIKMRVKPGLGDKLFELATLGMAKSGASDRFIIARENEDADVLWNFEVFKSSEAKAAYENSSLADELRDEPVGRTADAHGCPSPMPPPPSTSPDGQMPAWQETGPPWQRPTHSDGTSPPLAGNPASLCFPYARPQA